MKISIYLNRRVFLKHISSAYLLTVSITLSVTDDGKC